MIIGAHDCITYMQSRWWITRPFDWMSRCQKKDIAALYDEGVRCFDFRIRFRFGKPYLCHGICEYNKDIEELLGMLNNKASINNEKIYIRLGYENIFTTNDYEMFLEYGHEMIKRFSNLLFQICKKKPQWTVIENYFDKQFVEIQQVPDWKTIWQGPEKLAKLQDGKLEQYKEQDIIVSMDFI